MSPSIFSRLAGSIVLVTGLLLVVAQVLLVLSYDAADRVAKHSTIPCISRAGSSTSSLSAASSSRSRPPIAARSRRRGSLG